MRKKKGCFFERRKRKIIHIEGYFIPIQRYCTNNRTNKTSLFNGTNKTITSTTIPSRGIIAFLFILRCFNNMISNKMMKLRYALYIK